MQMFLSRSYHAATNKAAADACNVPKRHITAGASVDRDSSRKAADSRLHRRTDDNMQLPYSGGSTCVIGSTPSRPPCNTGK